MSQPQINPIDKAIGKLYCRLFGHAWRDDGWCRSCAVHITWGPAPQSDTCLGCGVKVEWGSFCSPECAGEWEDSFDQRKEESE